MAFRQPVRSGAKPDRARSAAVRSSGKTHATSSREIPDKLYFRIGEVARLCEVAPYVLRFWESEFPQLKPNKGGTGQRLYRRRDVEMALRVKTLLYDEGYTIAGARQYLKGDVRDKELPTDDGGGVPSLARREALLKLRGELQALLAMLSQPAAARPRGGSVQSIRAAKPKPELASLFDGIE